MSSLKVPVTSADHSEGPENAPLTLVEYGDYQCPGCGQANPIVKQIQKHFGKRLRFVVRNFPLNESHPEAESAAETAEFAGAQGKFWQMHDALYENQDQLGLELYRTLAKEFGLSGPDLDASLTAGTYRGRVRAEFSSGVRSDVNATPTFYINGIRYDASFDFETLSAALQHAIEVAKMKRILPSERKIEVIKARAGMVMNHRGDGTSSTTAVYAALIGDILVAVSKAVAAVWTGSASMT